MSAKLHSERVHSKLGASSAHRWMTCPGSVALCSQMPPGPDSPYAAEGTGAHELAEKVFKETPNAQWYIGKEKFNGFAVTKEMANAVDDYVDYVRVIKNRLKGELLIEHKFHLKHLHPDFFGTCDAVVLQPFGELHVFDFKFGAGIAVDVEDNEQMQFYALGALELGDFEKVVLHICQPRAEHEDGAFRTWETTPKALIEFGKKLRAAAMETQKKDAPLRSGSQCRFCVAAPVCPELHKTAVETARTDFAEPKLPEVKRLTPEQIAQVVRHKKLIENWFDAVEDFALAEMKAGRKIPGLKIVHKRSTREWLDDKRAEIFLTEVLGDNAYSKKLLSVAQAEKLVPKDSLNGLFVQPPGALTAAHESDKRAPAILPSDDFEAPAALEDF